MYLSPIIVCDSIQWPGLNEMSKTKLITKNDGQLLPEAFRALYEAKKRRKMEKQQEMQDKEIGGRGGKDPTRYGDWEVKGRAIDF